MAKIKHGFSGQRLIVYPFYVIEQALNNPLVADLVVPLWGIFRRRKAIILIVRPVVESTF